MTLISKSVKIQQKSTVQYPWWTQAQNSSKQYSQTENGIKQKNDNPSWSNWLLLCDTDMFKHITIKIVMYHKYGHKYNNYISISINAKNPLTIPNMTS